MIPQLHQERYGELRRQLQAIATSAVGAEADRAALKGKVTEVHQFFQSQVLSLSLDELQPEVEQRVQSLLVEIDKQLRLLAMDTMFFGVARQSTTSNQRQSQIGDRLNTLIRYCNVLLGNGE